MRVTLMTDLQVVGWVWLAAAWLFVLAVLVKRHVSRERRDAAEVRRGGGLPRRGGAAYRD